MAVYFNSHSAAKRGFTLIELLIVVAIVGVLVAVLVAVLLGARSRAKVGQARDFVDNALSIAITKWQDDRKAGRRDIFPTSDYNDSDVYEGTRKLFFALVTEPSKAGKEAYIPKDAYNSRDNKGGSEFVDPWENPYRYRNWATTGRSAAASKLVKYNKATYDVVSAGPDGIFDNDDDVINGKK
jgi:general secretion pathway protein G